MYIWMHKFNTRCETYGDSFEDIKNVGASLHTDHIVQ